MPELAVSPRRLIDEATERLWQAGWPEPRRQASRLWRELQGGTTEQLVSDRPVDAEQAGRFRGATHRLSAGEPFAYVTGWAGFRHLSLRSDRRALIPRPETEGLVDLLLQRQQNGLVADLGTGTGCIALSLALEGGFQRVVGIDISGDALALAGTNAELAGASGKVDLVRSDFCAALGATSLDALISNPPYLTEREYAALDRSVRHWEPPEALRGGTGGLEATGRLMLEAAQVVKPGGWLALEIDCSRAAPAAQLANEHGWHEVSIHMDLFGRERYLLARRSDTR
ncbi:MAG TPA: peptide chain release factor N(5)-glutamine methyltransferase [Gemmatimonadales bacterium]|nr:peptide chain release factor N(5)-glutamine methyltransferase [Gemmatimonadales bacterium]